MGTRTRGGTSGGSRVLKRPRKGSGTAHSCWWRAAEVTANLCGCTGGGLAAAWPGDLAACAAAALLHAPDTQTETEEADAFSGLTVASWNIEGLPNRQCGDTEQEITQRTRVAMSELLEKDPSVICLQEVTTGTLPTIQERLGGRYLDAEGPHAAMSGSYFTKMFVRRADGLMVLMCVCVCVCVRVCVRACVRV